MNPLSAGRAEWEEATVHYPLPHKLSYGEVVEEPFRRYGDAIAWLDWEYYCIIKKIETMKPRSGATTALLYFLKSLAAKHGFRIYGQPVVYDPTCRVASASPLSQEELNAWYSKRGFVVGTSPNGVPWLWYPDAPRSK